MSPIKFLKSFSLGLISFFLLHYAVLMPEIINAQTLPEKVTITAKGDLLVKEIRVGQGDSVTAGDVC